MILVAFVVDKKNLVLAALYCDRFGENFVDGRPVRG
jgi:hypothetical protein